MQEQVTRGRDRNHRRWDGREVKQLFDRASEQSPWTLGYSSVATDTLFCASLPITGRLPVGLRGVLYRNGPARHERGGERYGHRWDGDGMVQAFRLDGNAVSHRAAFVETSKYKSERAAGRLLVSGFGTHVPGSQALPDHIDDVNAANISVLPVAGELLALWEPGSAVSVDQDTLETKGPKVWTPELAGFPFSAHPKREPDGTVWNFGADVLHGRLTIYCIDPSGSLRTYRTVPIEQLPPVHDFGVTKQHLVFLLPPLIVNEERLSDGMSFAEACEWRPGLGMRAVVIRKADWKVTTFELPPGCLFHVGNAWEDDAGVIRVAYLRTPDPRSLMAGWSIMRGTYRHAGGAELTLMELHPDGRTQQTAVPDLEVEFPAVDPSDVGRRSGRLACVERTAGSDPSQPGYDAVVLVDMEMGVCGRWHYGRNWLVEEHLLVKDRGHENEPARWLVGTALDLDNRETVLSVIDVRDIASGPVMQARLPYAVPLGLHGAFVATGG